MQSTGHAEFVFHALAVLIIAIIPALFASQKQPVVMLGQHRITSQPLQSTLPSIEHIIADLVKFISWAKQHHSSMTSCETSQELNPSEAMPTDLLGLEHLQCTYRSAHGYVRLEALYKCSLKMRFQALLSPMCVRSSARYQV